jgi:glycosyltransferase involved in cell wall biosynthesis
VSEPDSSSGTPDAPERAHDLRILGLDSEGIRDFRREDSRNAGLYRALDRRFDVVETISPPTPTWFSRINILTHFLPHRELWRRRAGLNPARFRRRSETTRRILESREGSFDLILQLYLLFAVDSPRPYVCYLDSTMALLRRHYPAGAPMTPWEQRAWLKLERAAYERAAHLFPMSGFVRTSLTDDYGVSPDRITVVGAGTNELAPSLEGKRHDRPIALFVGLDFARKGGRVLLDAWERVRRSMADAELWIVGTRRPLGPERDDLRWFGRIDRSGVAGLYEQASVFVLPAIFDPFPHVLREAMGHGLPCISTDGGAIPEIVRDGEFGLLVPTRDAVALAEALVALLSDSAKAERMGRAAHQHVVHHATWEAVAERMTPHIRAAAGVRPSAQDLAE